MDKKTKTQWFADAHWGIFNHYLAAPASSRGYQKLSFQEWNALVDSFDVESFADQLEYIGAGYYFLTLGQGTGHWCCPNPVWDEYVGRTPSLCAARDLPMEISLALQKRGIPMGLYIPAGVPREDEMAQKAIPFDLRSRENLDENLMAFGRWMDCIQYWGEHYGENIKMWWVDGVPMDSYILFKSDRPQILNYTAALRKGYAERLTSYNPGLYPRPVNLPNSDEDYTAGEVDFIFQLPNRYWTGEKIFPEDGMIFGERLHYLAIGGSWWGQGEPRFNDDLLIGWTKIINSYHGCVSWDVPVSFAGEISDTFIKQMHHLGRETGTLHQTGLN